MTAATEKWTDSTMLTDEQKALPVVARWKYISLLDDGSMKAVSLIDGKVSEINAKQVEIQELQVGDVSEVREGEARDMDVVILYKAGSKE